MSEETTDLLGRLPAPAPSLSGLAAALRNYARAAGDGTTPDGQPAGPAEPRVAETFAYCAALLDTHLARLGEQDPEKLNGPDLRARLVLAEQERAGLRAELEDALTTVARMWAAAAGADGDGADLTTLDVPDDPIALVRAERARWLEEPSVAAGLVAKMHAAAHGGVIRGPVSGVAEDVWALRVVCEKLVQAAEQYLDTDNWDEGREGELRLNLGTAAGDAAMVLHPADAEEHREPVDVVNAIADVLECRSALARVAAELAELPKLPAGERKAKREALIELCRERAGDPPYANTLTRNEILLDLLLDAWGVIANAGVHRGNWDAEHPDWVEAAEKWRDRWHLVTGVTSLDGPLLPNPAPPAAAEPVNVCEDDASAARRFAGQLEKLRAGLHELGITEGAGPWNISVDEWPVTAALHALHEIGAQLASAPADRAAAAAGELDVDALAVLPELADVADSLDAVPNAALLADVRRIAAGFRGLAYDPHDRPTEVLAVRRAAIAAGLIPVPDESLVRTYRGCTPPAPARTSTAVVTQATRPAATIAGNHMAITLTPGDTLVINAEPAPAAAS